LLEIAAEAIPKFEAFADDRSLGRAWYLVSLVHGSMHCRYQASAADAEQALHHYTRSGWPASTCFAQLASALFYGPTPVPEAIHRCKDLLAQADLGGVANVLPFLSGLDAMDGRFEEGRALLEQARSAHVELGKASFAESVCGAVEGELELLAGSPESAERALGASYQSLETMGDRAYLATRAADLAEVFYVQCRYDDAEFWSLRSSSGGQQERKSSHGAGNSREPKHSPSRQSV
jgi:hypothetical protein